MGIQVALQLSLCGLCLTLTLLGGGTAVEIPDPPAVDCAWSRWTEWSSCDPCTKTRRRSREIQVFGQFGGKACRGSIGDKESCTTEVECSTPPPPECSDREFQCESGVCINARLQCNGDYDCEDTSDEDCEPVRKPCGTTVLDTNEQGRTAGYGINILGADPRMNPFNNDYFNGRCDRVRNPNTAKYDRLPWNVGILNYQTQVDETVSREIYEDTNSLLKEMLKESTVNFDFGLNFKFDLSEESMSNDSVKVNLSLQYERKSMIREVSSLSAGKTQVFMRVKGNVQLSTYRLRSRELHVAEEFLKHVQSLPLQYEKGIYFAFLEDYGTHYTRNGKSGGEYEFIYVLNHDVMKTKHLSERRVQECVKVGITVDISVNTTGRLKYNDCGQVKTSENGTADGKALVDKVMTSVKGGTLESAVTMRAKLNKEGVMDIDTYQNWVRTLADAPALLHSEPEPIHTLIPVTLPDANSRIANLKRATGDYVAEYNVCKCKPCQNGGALALVDGKCMCLCTHQFEGLACQNYKADKSKNTGGTRPAVVQEGNWSCWSSWTACTSGTRGRTRSCNTEGLQGAVCGGDTNSKEDC